MKQFHVYEDWTLEEQSRCFYVGKGDDSRVLVLKRGRAHTDVAQRWGQRREVVFTTTDEHEAFERERALILLRHVHPRDPDYNGIGCNRTLGGQGPSGRIVTDETRKRISESNRGRPKNRTWSDEERAALSRRMSLLHKGKKISEEHKQAMREHMRDPARKQMMVDAVSAKLRHKYDNDPAFVQRIRESRARGESCGSSLFTEEQVRIMRHEYDALDKSVRGVKRRFYLVWANRTGATGVAVRNVVLRNTWKHVP